MISRTRPALRARSARTRSASSASAALRRASCSAYTSFSAASRAPARGPCRQQTTHSPTKRDVIWQRLLLLRVGLLFFFREAKKKTPLSLVLLPLSLSLSLASSSLFLSVLVKWSFSRTRPPRRRVPLFDSVPRGGSRAESSNAIVAHRVRTAWPAAPTATRGWTVTSTRSPSPSCSAINASGWKNPTSFVVIPDGTNDAPALCALCSRDTREKREREREREWADRSSARGQRERAREGTTRRRRRRRLRRILLSRTRCCPRGLRRDHRRSVLSFISQRYVWYIAVLPKHHPLCWRAGASRGGEAGGADETEPFERFLTVADGDLEAGDAVATHYVHQKMHPFRRQIIRSGDAAFSQ